MTEIVHVCRTEACFMRHASQEDGRSRCLWGSRNGSTPTRKWNQGAYCCSLPSRGHMWGPDATPHQFTLRYAPALRTRHTVCVVIGSIAGTVLVILAALAAIWGMR